MANKRNRQKQRNSSKTIEGYERHLLQEADKWASIGREAESGPKRSGAFQRHRQFIEMHEHLRRFYFDL